jgi:uncharacterized protein with HEPN domain
MGEAAKNKPQVVKEQYPQAPWKQVASMRDILIHCYFGVDIDLTWKAAKKDNKDFKRILLFIKKDLQTGQ